jgi:hypothetical protein
MNDTRAERAQELFWRIADLRDRGLGGTPILVMLREMARLHEDRARELLNREDLGGWTDLFAAVTAWAEAGEARRVRSLLDLGYDQASRVSDGRDAIETELRGLAEWSKRLSVPPALSELAQPTPPLPKLAA